jgi:uncharacterized protein (TIGR00106 family)
VAVVGVAILPIGTAKSSLSDHVAGTLEPLKKSGLEYELTSMGTNIEGPLDEVLQVVAKMHETPFRSGVKRVFTTIVIDDRRDRELSIKGKKSSVTGKR